MISFIILLTIIIYLLIDDLHNKDDKWEVALFIRFSKVIVYENYIYIYIYIYIRLNEMSKNEFLVMINMISIVRVWLVLNLNLVL